MENNDKFVIDKLFNPADVDAARELIDKSHRIVLAAHQSPDGDAIGSTLGLASYLRTKGKKATVIVPNSFPAVFNWMEGADDIILYDRQKEKADKAIARADLIFYLDLNSSGRMLELGAMLDAQKTAKVLIDHHLNPEIKTDVAFSYPEASSTCELVLRFIHELGERHLLSKEGAECLCTGLITDTGAFQYNSNYPEFFILLAMLIDKGADKDRIYRRIFHANNKSRYTLLGKIFSNNIEYIDELHASVFTLSKEELNSVGYEKGDAEGFVNMPLGIKGMKLSISLREDIEKANLVHVSIRSVDDIPANEISSRFFNGGGHFNAAGGRLTCSLEEALEITHKALEAYADILRDNGDC